MTDADELYRALESSGRLSKLRRLTYRCRAGRCLLLDAVETPLGIVVHQPPHKRSPALNEASSTPAGRTVNTSDGDRRWTAQTYWFATSALARIPGATFLICDHVYGVPGLDPARFRADWDAGRTEVLI